MNEDWFWTASIVYENGIFSDDYNWEAEAITVKGIDGSAWATPVMDALFKNGQTYTIPCFFDDGEKAPLSQIAEQKAFAALTGGMRLW